MVTGVQVWSEYAKDYFDFYTDRVNELRNRGRQLAAAIGVVIGLEVMLLGRLVLDVAAPFNPWLFSICLLGLISALAYQLVLLSGLFEKGYSWETIKGGPESPNNEKLKQVLSEKDEEQAKKILALYYADAGDQLYHLADKLSKQVGKLGKSFGRSLWLLFVSSVGFALLRVLPKLGVS